MAFEITTPKQPTTQPGTHRGIERTAQPSVAEKAELSVASPAAATEAMKLRQQTGFSAGAGPARVELRPPPATTLPLPQRDVGYGADVPKGALNHPPPLAQPTESSLQFPAKSPTFVPKDDPAAHGHVSPEQARFNRELLAELPSFRINPDEVKVVVGTGELTLRRAIEQGAKLDMQMLQAGGLDRWSARNIVSALAQRSLDPLMLESFGGR